MDTNQERHARNLYMRDYMRNLRQKGGNDANNIAISDISDISEVDDGQINADDHPMADGNANASSRSDNDENRGSDDNDNDFYDNNHFPYSEDEIYRYDSSSSEEEDIGLFPEDRLEPQPHVPTTREELASWVTRYGHGREDVSELLSILNRAGLDLPNDRRTLVKTPRTTLVQEKFGGDYAYLGVKDALIEFSIMFPDFVERSDRLKILANVDPIPIFKSQNTSLQPILILVANHRTSRRPYIVSLFYGSSKPNSVSDYIADFMDEITQLRMNGVVLRGKRLRVSFIGFSNDTPIRTWLKCTVGHTGAEACERCDVTAHRYPHTGNRMLFFRHNGQKRTDDGFKLGNYLEAGHQTSISPLATDYNFPCVSRFILDALHMYCLGVVKRFFFFLVYGPREVKLSSHQQKLISEKLTSYTLPSEFNRSTLRALKALKRWKGTELRSIGLYVGMVAMKGIVSDEVYKLFMKLCVAISMLYDSNDDRRNDNIEDARNQLCAFVTNARNVLGDCFPVFNVHSIKHIPDDVENYNMSLNDMSAFPFENYLQFLKKMVKCSQNVITQVVNRVHEARINRVFRTSSRGPYRKISPGDRDGCFLSNDSLLFVTRDNRNDTYMCDKLNLRFTVNFFSSPFPSKDLGISFVSATNRRRVRKDYIISEDELAGYRKLICLPFDDDGLDVDDAESLGNGHVFIPLLHGDEGDERP